MCWASVSLQPEESQGEANSQSLGVEAAAGTVPRGALLAVSVSGRVLGHKYLVRYLVCCSGHSHHPLGRNQLLS